MNEINTFEQNGGTEEHRQVLRDFMAKGYYAPSFILMMENSGVISFHERPNQPCYGEMRKYRYHSYDYDFYDYDYDDDYDDEDSAPRFKGEIPMDVAPGSDLHLDCTQPDDSRPGDLFHPFPDGHPVAVGFVLPCGEWSGEDRTGLYKAYFSKDSPWLAGYDVENIELVRNGSGEVIGVIFYDTRFDPTVIVNLMNLVGNATPSVFEKCSEKYGRKMGIILSSIAGATSLICRPGYYHPQYLNVRAMMEGTPNTTLTGGTWYDRFDYNRKSLHEVFGSNDQPENMDGYLNLTDYEYYRLREKYGPGHLSKLWELLPEDVLSLLGTRND